MQPKKERIEMMRRKRTKNKKRTLHHAAEPVEEVSEKKRGKILHRA